MGAKGREYSLKKKKVIIYSLSKHTIYRVLDYLGDKNSMVNKTQPMSSKSLQVNATANSSMIKNQMHSFWFGLWKTIDTPDT